MPPKDKKKKAKKPKEVYLTDEASLAQFGAGQLVRTVLGCTATVLGVKAGAQGPELFVRYAGGLEAPLEQASMRPADPAQQLRLDVEQRRREQAALDDKWRAYNEEQARKEAVAAAASAKKKKKAAAPAAEAPTVARLASGGPEAAMSSARSAAAQPLVAAAQ